MSEIFKKYMEKVEEIFEENLDGTGPEGKGPKTGRGEGDCDIEDNIEDDEDNEEVTKSTIKETESAIK